MCCDVAVLPHTLENCLVHCNLTANFPLTMSRPCRICENGGRLNSSSLSCQCDIYIMKVAAAKVRNLNCAFDA